MKRGYAALCIAFLLLPTTLFSRAKTESKEYEVDRSEFDWKLVWSDEFDSEKIDTNKWNYVIGAGGYGNNELQYYSDREDNARIEDGKLVLEAHKEDFDGAPYTSAKLTTAGKGDWTYGKYEIRAKLPKGQGIWPAFWMMPSDYNLYGAWPSCGEIDIMELIGHEPSTTYGTLHYGNPHKYTGTSTTLEEGTFNDDYHIFGLEWLPGEIRWYLDGKLFQTQKDWFSSPDSLDENITFPAPFDRDFYLQLNLAVGGDWPGYPDETTVFPQRIEIDWIRVYEAEKYPRPKPPKKTSSKPVKGRAPMEDGNYVYNSGFDNGMGNWTFGLFEGGSGSAEVENGEIHIAIKNGGGQTWGNQLVQTEMNIQKGHTYNLSFKARAAAPRNIMVKIGGLEARGWAAYSGEKVFSLDTDMKEYTYSFTMREESDVKARYEFNLGLSSEDVWLDDVVIVKEGGENAVAQDIIPAREALASGNLLYNGGFEYGDYRTAYWDLELDANSDAMLFVDSEVGKRALEVTTISNSGLENGIILKQGGFQVKNDNIYKISLDGTASDERTIYAVLVDEQGRKLSNEIALKVSYKTETLSGEFETIGESKDATLVIDFSKDGSDSKVLLDNISLKLVKKPIKVVGLTKIEAEDFYDKSLTPQTEACAEGTLNVGWMTEGDWLDYRLDLDESGTYNVTCRVASAMDSVPFGLTSDIDNSKGMIDGSGDWQNWISITKTIELPEGVSNLRLTGVDVNINWIELSPAN